MIYDIALDTFSYNGVTTFFEQIGWVFLFFYGGLILILDVEF